MSACEESVQPVVPAVRIEGLSGGGLGCSLVGVDTDEAPSAEVAKDGALARRANRLANALDDLGITAKAAVVVACCDQHHEDAAVARLALAALRAHAVIYREGDPAPPKPDLVLACAEGFYWWERLKTPARMVSDVPGCLWWRLLECTHPATPLPERPL